MPCPAFERYAVTLTLRAPVRLHFNHGGAVMGLLAAGATRDEIARVRAAGHERPSRD